VLASVVGAKEQLAVVHNDPNVGLSATSVAAVGRGELVGGALLVDGTIFGGDLGHILLLQTDTR
jgi:hypothetical protein